MASPEVTAVPSSVRPMKRWRFWLIAVLVFVALVVGGFFVEEGVRGRVQWQHYAKEAKDRGVKLDFADFIPSKIPDPENFASIPVFEACAQAVDRGQSAPNPFELPKPAIGVKPQGSDAQGQKPIDLVAWQVYFF